MKDKLEHRIDCPICHNYKNNNLGKHIQSEHGRDAFRRAILDAKRKGMPDHQIGEVFGITFRELEKIITEEYGINISILKKPKKVKYWVPRSFVEETTTVWSYKQRGDWATHDGRYRGNWSPYIPRNVILKYSKLGDTVLDYFVGGGTTAVEAKLLGRKCIAIDINPACIGLTKENLNFELPKTIFREYHIFEPEVYVGDARNMSKIKDNSIDLICAHPPYAGIISYSSNVEGDLSKSSIEEFLNEMKKVARESFRVLKPGRKCAILIGDTRKHKHVLPIGFQTINVFLDVGFKLKELVIKRQHNCKTTGFWAEKSTRYNFLLLAHEYLPIFEKPKTSLSLGVREKEVDYDLAISIMEEPSAKKRLDELETTTVWIFPEKDFEECLNKNVIDRYSKEGRCSTITFVSHSKNKMNFTEQSIKTDNQLLFIKSPFLNSAHFFSNIECYLERIKEVVNQGLPNLNNGGFLVIQTRDIRINEYIEPLGKRIIDMLTHDNLWLKEIIVVTQERQKPHIAKAEEDLSITHQYLLVYEKTKKNKYV